MYDSQGEFNNNLPLVYDSVGEYYHAKKLHQKALMIRKRFFVKIMQMKQQIITTWHQCTTDWEKTIKPKNFTKQHLWFAKRFLVKIMPM